MKIPKTFLPDKDLEEKVEEMLTPKKRKFIYAPKFNMLKVDDKKVQYFYDLWCEQAFTSDNAQKDSVVESYLIHVLGVSKVAFEAFKNNEDFVYHEIGMRQGGAVERKNDFKAFWSDMKKIFPFEYAEEDADFLTSSEEFPIFSLLSQFQTYGPNSLLTRLKVNAHAYK